MKTKQTREEVEREMAKDLLKKATTIALERGIGNKSLSFQQGDLRICLLKNGSIEEGEELIRPWANPSLFASYRLTVELRDVVEVFYNGRRVLSGEYSALIKHTRVNSYVPGKWEDQIGGRK